MESVDRKHRRFLARHRALAATFRKRKRAEAVFDLTCDRSSAPYVGYSSLFGIVGARQMTAGSALHSNRAQQDSVAPSITHKAARSTRSTFCRPASPSSKDSCDEHAFEQLNPVVLHPGLHSNPAQKQQHAHAPAAAALDERSPYQASPQQSIACRANPHHSDPDQAGPHQATPLQAGLFQANPYQQPSHYTAVVDRYTGKHDSFRMISNDMAGRSADRLRSSGRLHHQGCSVQSHTDACSCMQEPPAYKKQRAVHIAGSAALPAAHAGHPTPLLPKVTETMERHLQMRGHSGKAPSTLCAASQWVDATVIPHSLPFQSLNHSTAGSAGSHALAGDAVQCSASGLPANLEQLRDPRPKANVEVLEGASACFPDQPPASTHAMPLTPPQTVPQCNQFLLEGSSQKRPPAGPAGLRLVPLVKAPARASIVGAGFTGDDSVTITPSHRQTWDWSHGPLYSFRALCRAPIQQHQHQQQQVSTAAQHGSYTPSSDTGSRASVSETHRTWQNYLPLPLPDCSQKRYLSRQQPSISDIAAGISHHSSLAPRPTSASAAYSSEQFSLHHELLPFCSTSSAQQPQFQRFFQCSSSPTLPVLLPCSLSHPSVSPSASVSLPAVPDTSPSSSSAVQHAVQAASVFTQRQMTRSPSDSRALSSPLPWQTNMSFDFPIVCGLPKLGPTVWSSGAVVPNKTCRLGPDPRFMVADDKTHQQGHIGDPCGAELDLQELQRSTLSWMASELMPAGSYDAFFYD